MATPSGQISFSQINLELGVSPTSTQANIGSAPFRGLAGVPSGQISMSNLQGKSSFTAMSATGGLVYTPGDGYKYHIFTSPGSFIVSSVGAGPGSGTIEYVVVAGGGGGGFPGGMGAGGGGAGGLVYNSSYGVTTTTYPLTVGSGGGAVPPTSGANGTPSTAFGITAVGGGYGAWRPGPRTDGNAGNPGGSGGGGGSFGTGDPSPGLGIQPSQNPGIPNLIQYGNPGLPFPNSTNVAGPGGSSNASNDRNTNATFPNGSTILSGSPVGPQAIARGGSGDPPTGQWPGTSYGSGGAAGGGSPGISGIIIIRYPI